MSQTTQKLLGWLSTRLNLTEVFSLLTSYGLFYTELDPRKPLAEALEEALEKPVPSYSRWPRVLGLVVLVLLAVEILTGGLLALYYLPTPQSAHASVATILRDVDFGALIYQTHFWGAQMLIAVLILRLVRFFLQRVYRRPRELVWVFGVLLLLVSLHADLTGRFLPWTTSSYWSTVRAIEVLATVPVISNGMLFFIGTGGSFISDVALIRSYILHIAVLPLLALALVYFHFSTVRRIGLSGEEKTTSIPGRRAVRAHLASLAIIFVLLLGVLMTFAVLAPLPFESKADPFSTPSGIGPPWYLLAPFGLLEMTAGFLPRWIVGLAMLMATVAAVALPFLHRPRPEEAGGRRPLVWAAAAIIVVSWVLLTLYGASVA
ncbi:MAG: cytochrome bc complex cytochrome b subunit [bacterium]|nr:cytochrome bc complex cytochrome b subunit [bacterium]